MVIDSLVHIQLIHRSKIINTYTYIHVRVRIHFVRFGVSERTETKIGVWKQIETEENYYFMQRTDTTAARTRTWTWA